MRALSYVCVHVCLALLLHRSSDPQAACVAESVEQFITAMDTLKLNMRAVDQLCPVLLALMNSMDKISSLPPNYGPREKIRVRGSSGSSFNSGGTAGDRGSRHDGHDGPFTVPACVALLCWRLVAQARVCGAWCLLLWEG